MKNNMTPEELELQKNRLEILKMSGRHEGPTTQSPEDETLYAWQYELNYYKRLRRRERFYMFGSICGILSLVLVIATHFSPIGEFVIQFLLK